MDAALGRPQAESVISAMLVVLSLLAGGWSWLHGDAGGVVVAAACAAAAWWPGRAGHSLSAPALAALGRRLEAAARRAAALTAGVGVAIAAAAARSDGAAAAAVNAVLAASGAAAMLAAARRAMARARAFLHSRLRAPHAALLQRITTRALRLPSPAASA